MTTMLEFIQMDNRRVTNAEQAIRISVHARGRQTDTSERHAVDLEANVFLSPPSSMAFHALHVNAEVSGWTLIGHTQVRYYICRAS